MTDDKATTRLNAIFESQTKDSVELLLYKRNSQYILYINLTQHNPLPPPPLHKNQIKIPSFNVQYSTILDSD